ncbi:MAG: T9SS type A sorting domain-containing protein [Ignavibacteriaceae bacterium]
MLKIFSLFIVVISLGSLSAQTFIGKLNAGTSGLRRLSAGNDTLKILAVMVNFQEDKDEATFGNGRFGSIYSQDYGLSILDPLPHDRQYFDAHLQFAKNYFDKVSNGKQKISFYVLPDTFSVSKTMRNYSPPSNSSDFTKLADFSKEVWTKAAQIYPDFNFKDYDIFLIFHAGVGRDISLPGSVGDERDLPSIYLSTKTLKDIYGQNYSGFPVSNGTFNITNSMLIPETESRELSGLGGIALIQISINGLLVSSIASYLGLPDLFDTQTGKSAIGRFGLMDGQAIFAYNGLFPPEPSAWEKIFLGWAEPVSVKPGNYHVNLFANLASKGNDTTILKVPINSSEYYLLENRIRDANKNGARIKYVLGGDTLTKVFPNDTTGFYSYDTDSLKGVVIDVDEFDWAVPGNGIVLWHIDDNIINAKIADNQINTDIQHRGVGVVEADGIQDIGKEYTDVFGDVVVGEGTPEDFWYSSNPAHFYENKFGKDTRPSSTTNSGAYSLITISNFSNYADKMSFNVSYGDSLIVPVFSTKLNLPSADNHLTNFLNKFAVLNDSDLIIVGANGNVESTLHNFSKFKPASVNINNTNYIAGVSGKMLNIWSDNPENLNAVNVNEEITSPPVIINNTANPEILFGTYSGKILTYSLNSQAKIDSLSAPDDVWIKKIAAYGDDIYYVGVSKIAALSKSKSGEYPEILFSNKKGAVTSSQNIYDLALTKDADGNNAAVILSDNNYFGLASENGFENFSINSSANITSFALADLKQDGENYIIFNNGSSLEAVNLKGVSADNFPFKDPLEIGFTGTPLAADFSGNKNSEILAETKDGRIYAIDGETGKVLDGFPFSAGAELSSVPSLFENNGKISMAAINNENNFSAWVIGASSGTIYWGEENGNSLNNSFLNTAQNTSVINEFFPKEKAYNYPNPVYNNQTFIHYYVSEDSKINIKIFDLAGDFVAELNDNAKGGMDNETMWKVNDIQSGVYLARIEAAGSSGKTETNIIKIAIIK